MLCHFPNHKKIKYPHPQVPEANKKTSLEIYERSFLMFVRGNFLYFCDYDSDILKV
jgi:hypothetical protein